MPYQASLKVYPLLILSTSDKMAEVLSHDFGYIAQSTTFAGNSNPLKEVSTSGFTTYFCL